MKNRIGYLFIRDIEHGFFYLRIKAVVLFLVLAIAIGFKVFLFKQMADFTMVDLGVSAFQYFQGFTFGVGFLPSNALFIPIEFALIVSFIFFLIGDYFYYDLKQNGVYLISRSKSKINFWLSKVLWLVVNVVFYYLIVFGLILLGSLFLANKTLSSGEISLILMSWGMMFLITLSLSLFQVFLTLIIKPVFALGVNLALFASSIYIFFILLPWQHGMLARSELMDSASGIPIWFSISYGVILGVSSILAGCYVIRKKDII